MKRNKDTWDQLIIVLIEKGASLKTIVDILKPLRGKSKLQKRRMLKAFLKTYSKKNVTFPNETYAEGETEERNLLLARAEEKLNRPKTASLPW